MNAIQPLPLTVRLRPRETAFSFMSRLGARNHVSATDLGRDFEVPFQRVLDGDPAAIASLAMLSGVEAEELRAWSPQSLPGTWHDLRGEMIPSKVIRNPQIRGCPACLREDAAESNLPSEQAMAIRGDWLVPHLMICLQHGQPLVPLWRVSQSPARYDTAPHLSRLAPDILSGDLDQDSRESTGFDAWVEHRLSTGPASTWLDEHPLHAAATFCYLLGSALLRHEMSAPSSAHPDDRWAICQMGFDVARHGEQAIQGALQGLQDLRGGPHQGPKAIYPVLYDRLSNDYRDDPDYGTFSKILRDHLLKTWPLGPGDELMGEPVTERRLHSVRTASRETGVDPRRLRKMLEGAGILNSTREDAWAVFDAEAAAPLLDSLATLLPAKTFAEAFSMTRSQFDILVADGVLVPMIEGGATKNIWSPRDGQALMDGLLCGAELLRQAQHGWEHISRSAQRLKVRPKAIIDAILDGRINRVGNHSDFDGYAAIYVYHDEVASVLGADTNAPAAMSIEVFGKAIGALQLPAFRRLIVNGLTPSTEMRNPRTKALQQYITAEDAAAFHARFVTLRTLAKATGLSWQTASAALREAGVQPFSPDGVDYGNIFAREDAVAALLVRNEQGEGQS